MLKRPFKSLIARIAIVALALSLVFPFVPAAFAQDTSFDYAENGTGPVATFIATDQDGDAIVWSLSGADEADFTIAGGVLAFKKSPNFESAGDDDGNNVYEVTVEASGGSTDVMVTVTNVDEMGSVTIDDLQPQAGESMGATVTDPDGDREQTTWQWSKSMDQGTWMDIAGATSQRYTPEDDDIGYYLRATASYLDGVGTERDSASGVTAFPVEERPLINAPPSFPDENAGQNRPVKETAKDGASVGNAVVASDADNDPLLYTLKDGYEGTNSPPDEFGINSDDDDATDADADGHSLLFKIDSKTGQISVNGDQSAAFDREATPATPASYSLRVIATDPSGSTATVVVTINVQDVDEAPTIALADADFDGSSQSASIVTEAGEFSVNTNEEAVLNLDPDADAEDEFDTGLPVFDAYDPENPDPDKVRWSISGPDAKRFEIAELTTPNTANTDTAEGDDVSLTRVDSSAALRWAGTGNTGPSFEDNDSADGDNVYEVTVTAFDGTVGKSQAVLIKLRNTEDAGSVSLTQRTPQVGIPVTARLSDEDGGIKDLKWTWYSAVADPAALPTTACDPDAATPAVTDCVIPGAESSTYTPATAYVGNALTVRAMYFDAVVTDTTPDDGTDDGDVIIKTTDGATQARPDANAAPSFGKDESGDRSVAENAAVGTLVGDPVTATDKDPAPRNLLIYSLSGDGSDNFKVDNDGQISTKKKLDFEAQSSYSLMLTATDPSGASASITVNIAVTDEDDGAVITANGAISYAENGTGPVATFTATDPDGDAIVWSLSGADEADFTIAGGVLAFKKSPNFESAGDDDGNNVYEVTVEASGGSTDVMVTVTNVDEMGSVTIDDLQPQAGESMGATVTDPDGDREQTTWQWSKSMDQGTWMDIAGATSQRYTPEDDDIGYYLRATASYLDGVGTERDSASGVTAFPVEERPLINAPPSFPDENAGQNRPVKETAKDGASVGNAVVASDADNDPLLYTLKDGYEGTNSPPDEFGINSDDDDATDADADGHSLLFKIDSKTGQISVNGDQSAAFDREATPATPASYSLRVIATDPSGSTATVVVTINVQDVDEAPTIALADADFDGSSQSASIVTEAGEFSVNTNEEAVLNLDPDADAEDEFDTGLPVFDAYDPENPDPDKVRWSISGPDAKRFEIAELTTPNTANTDTAEGDDVSLTRVDSSAALRWAGTGNTGPSFEDNDSADGDNVYEVTVTAFDGTVGKSQAVLIKLRNTEDAGSVSLTQRTPQVGIPVTARLSDEDGGIKDLKWTWYSAVADPAALPTTACDPDAATPAVTDCVIPGAESSTYTPATAYVGNALTVRAMYFDAVVTDTTPDDGTDDGDVIIKTTDGATQARPDANAAPSFGKDESGDRSVAENAAVGTLVGDPVTATDKDPAPRNLLIYSLSGDGSDNFKVDNDGQISTKKKLDFEAQSSYSLMLTATDPSGASASITVNITVTDEDDGAVIKPATENSAPAFADESVTLSVDENTEAGSPVGDPIVATDKDGEEITYSLDDSSVVEIWPSGQLTVAEGANLDYEGDANSYTVTLTASDGTDSSSVMITINVNNVGLDNPYDADDNGEISKDEAVTAVDDYFLDNITREEVNAVLALYFG